MKRGKSPLPPEDLDYNRIYDEYRPKVHGYLTRLVGPNDAEDLAQETFIRVNHGLGTFKGQSSLATWIYRIATNTATDRLRSRAFKQETATVCTPEPNDYPRHSVAGHPSVDDQLIRKEMNQCIHSYVDYLPDNYRTVLLLSEFEGFTNGEIAAILGQSLAAVKIKLHRAKEKLRRELAANCTFYRTDCNQLACEAKGPVRIPLKPLAARKKPISS